MTKLRIFMHSEIEKSSNTQNARTTYENISNALFIVIFNGRIKSLRNLNIFDRVLNDINEMNETNEIKWTICIEICASFIMTDVFYYSVNEIL